MVNNYLLMNFIISRKTIVLVMAFQARPVCCWINLKKWTTKLIENELFQWNGVIRVQWEIGRWRSEENANSTSQDLCHEESQKNRLYVWRWGVGEAGESKGGGNRDNCNWTIIYIKKNRLEAGREDGVKKLGHVSSRIVNDAG